MLYADLSQLELIFPGKILSVERIVSGMTNRNYKCILTNGQKYVVRLPGLGSVELVNRVHEAHILQELQPLNIDVKTVLFDVQTGVKITEFVEDCTILSDNRSIVIDHGVKILKLLHNSGLDFKFKFDYWQKIQDYLEICDELEIDIQSTFYQMLKEIKRLKNLDPFTSSLLCPCHNDPAPENFLLKKSGEVLLIDWEYGAINDPIWDLAAFSLEIGLNDVEDKQIFHLYYDGKFNFDIFYQKMLLNKTQQDFLWYVWSKIKIFFGQNIRDYAAFRIKRGEENFKILINYNAT